MIYEIRFKGRQKQGECSAILTMTFLVLLLIVISINLMPMVYVSVVKSLLAETGQEKTITLAISSVLLFASVFIFSCLSYGTDRFMLKRAENTVAGAGDIFYFFAPKRVVPFGVFLMKLTFYKTFLLTVLLVPFIICTGVFVSLCAREFSALVCSVFAVFSLVFLLAGCFAFLQINDTLFLVRYRFIKGEYINFRQLLSQSQQDMTGKTLRLRKLKGSFAGWFLLCAFIFPLPYVWSYYRQTKACFAVLE